jgi:hypothetical protein
LHRGFDFGCVIAVESIDPSAIIMVQCNMDHIIKERERVRETKRRSKGLWFGQEKRDKTRVIYK